MEASTEASREKMKTIESFSLGNLVRELKYKIWSQFQHIQYLLASHIKGKYNPDEPGWPHTLVSHLLYMGGYQWRGS